jgi:predicted ATPase/DNA-binding SARP family transcriptional activator
VPAYTAAVLRISVLGPVEATRDGVAVPVPRGKAAELLVRLALEPGRTLSAERLLDELWHGAVDARRNTLQSKVTRLRRAFGDPEVIVGGKDGYRLAFEPAQVDVGIVIRDATAAGRLLESGDVSGAAALSAATLDLFPGDLLPGAGDGTWVNPHRRRLEEVRMRLIQTSFSARLDLGAPGALVGDLETAVASYPYQEGLWALLITALYRDGRQADALSAYGRVRSLLQAELALDPGPPLQDLERRILNHDPSLDIRPAAASAAARDEAGNLPVVSDELVGREVEAAEVSELVSARHLVEIVGTAGVGKTALAIAVGRCARSGPVWLVRLEAASTPGGVLDALVAAMGASGEPAALERLRAIPALVILDNCEHVLDAAADLVTRLLAAVPEMRILCTGQIPLGIEGAAVMELTPLPLTDAVELFARRAPRGGDNAEAVRDLCAALDGLPLAIELAAARRRTLSIEEIGRRLDDRFVVLRDPTSRRPERRRALRAAIGWSYELLFPDDKRGLWAMASFAGGASPAAAEAVLAALDVPPATAIDVFGRLANRSLLIVDGEESVRYRLLDSIRAFALEALAEEGLAERAHAAHAAWLAAAARGSTAAVRSAAQAVNLDLILAERANIDTALTWTAGHDPLLGLEITTGFGWGWIVLGDSRGAERILRSLEAAGESASLRERLEALLLAAWIEASTGHLDRARDHLAMASVLADEIGDPALTARCLYHRAYVVSHHGEWDEASALTDRADALFGESDEHAWDQAANWLFASRAAISAADHERAAAARERVDHWVARVDDPWIEVRREAMLGELARLEHRFDDAVDHLGSAAETSLRLGFLQTGAYQTSSLGRAQCQAGEYAAGADTLEVAIEQAEATGDLRLAALVRVHLGRVLRALDRDEAARSVLEEADAWHRTTGGGEQAALGECLLAALNAADGLPGAVERLSAIVAVARQRDDAPVEVFALDALGRARSQAGDRAGAVALCEEADRRMDAASHFIAELDRVDARAVRLAAGSSHRVG